MKWVLTDTLAVLAVGAVIAAVLLERIRRQHLRVIERSSLRVRIGHALAEGLVAGRPIADVIRILVPDRADWCVLHLIEGSGVRRAAVVHADPDIERRMQDLFASQPFVANAPNGPASVIRSGQPELVREVPPAVLEPLLARRLPQLAGLGSAISVPIKAQHDIVGALTLARRAPHAYEEDDLAWAQDVAHRIGLAIENRRLYVEARELFEQSVSANFVTAPDGTMLACNRTFAELLGFDSPAAALATRASSLYIDPQLRDELLDQLQAQKRFVGREVSLRRQDGAVVSVLADAAGEFDEQGRLTKIRGFLLDRTAHKGLEERLRQAQRLEAVGQLAGGMAHDFDNLLAVILGCADLLKADIPRGRSDGPSPLDDLTQAARRAASLTEQLLAFSRRQILQPRLFGLNDALRNMHMMLRQHVPTRIVLMLELDPRIEPVRADPEQLERAIVNLVVNAVDAMPAAGMLTVSTRPIDTVGRDAAQYVSMAPGRYVILSVQDTGVGMDALTCTRAFEPFFTTKSGGTGVGLGLSTVYGVVKQSGGYVWITSTQGAGTVVKICLPGAADEPRTTEFSPPELSRESRPIPSGPAPVAGC